MLYYSLKGNNRKFYSKSVLARKEDFWEYFFKPNDPWSFEEFFLKKYKILIFKEM